MEEKDVKTEGSSPSEISVTIREKVAAPESRPTAFASQPGLAGQREAHPAVPAAASPAPSADPKPSENPMKPAASPAPSADPKPAEKPVKPAATPAPSADPKPAENSVKPRSGRSAGRHSASGRKAKKSATKQGGSSIWRDLLYLLIKIAVIALVVFLVGKFVLGVHLNHGNHMYPFVMDGDLVITYKLDPYRVGDVVLYQDPISGKNRISRIVAKGGSTVVITQEGQLIVDNYIPNETVFYLTQPAEDSTVEYPYVVGDDGIFLLDDFRTDGRDSRVCGEIKTEDVKGKAVYIIRRRGI